MLATEDDPLVLIGRRMLLAIEENVAFGAPEGMVKHLKRNLDVLLVLLTDRRMKRWGQILSQRILMKSEDTKDFAYWLDALDLSQAEKENIWKTTLERSPAI
jgi:hypothetical protein